MGVTSIYVVMGGMLSVVLTDFIQFLLMALSSVVIAIVATQAVDPETLGQLTPPGWQDVFSLQLALDWSQILPAMNQQITDDGMASFFALFFMLMICKGVLVSMAGLGAKLRYAAHPRSQEPTRSKFDECDCFSLPGATLDSNRRNHADWPGIRRSYF